MTRWFLFPTRRRRRRRRCIETRAKKIPLLRPHSFGPFQRFRARIPSLLIVGASDVVNRPSEVELVYDERIASKKKALIILRDRSHEHAVTTSAGVAIGFLKRVFRGETTTTTGREDKEDKEEQEVDKLAMAAMESILNRKSKEKELEDPSVQRVRARGF